jgi:hypothetical protein
MKRLVLAAALAACTTAIAADLTKNACPPVAAGATPAVDSAKRAVEIAKSAFGRNLSPEYLARFEPFVARLQGRVWHVAGSRRPGTGGTLEATVCQANGEIMNILHAQ